MIEHDDGGPAFPTDSEHQSGPNTYHFTGMTLRDYFAVHCPKRLDSYLSLDDEAEMRYRYADAMLKARKQ